MDATTSPISIAPRQGRTTRAKAPFQQAVFVCGKCARKLGPDGKRIRKALKSELKGRRWGKVRLIETRCFDLCPKRRQVLASGRTLAERRLLVVEPGFSAGQALDLLLGAPETKPPVEPEPLSEIMEGALPSLSQPDPRCR